jgi:transcriptional regulator with XRE-family HTH domain
MTQITLAEKIRYLRKSRGMSQVQLARRLGLTNNAFISHVERGTKRPSDALLDRIAEVFAYDVASLRALAAPVANDLRQGELEPAPGADLLAQIRREAELFGERASELVAASLPAFLWGREQRALVEGTSREVWIIAPDLVHHGVAADLVQVATANLRRGVRYCYLLADSKEMRIEAGRMLKRYQERETGGGGSSAVRSSGARVRGSARRAASDRGLGARHALLSAAVGESAAAAAADAENDPAISFVAPASFPFIFECALFDPRDPERIRGSVLPAAGEWEIVLSREQALALAGHFARWWDRFAG